MVSSTYQEDLEKWFSKWLPGNGGEELGFDPKDLPEEFQNKPFNFNTIQFNPSDKSNYTEKELYSLLCPVIQNVFDLVAYRSAADPSYDALQIKDTSAWSEASDCAQCPDLSVHKASAAQAFHLDDDSKANVAAARKPFVGRTAYSWTLLPGEVKVDKSQEGFGLNEDELDLPDTKNACGTRGQVAEYIIEVLSRQHRRFTFAFYIYRNFARFLVVDRVAAVMTPPFDYVKDPKTFLKFFYRLARADAPAQGYDPTVALASPASITMLKEHMARDHGSIETLIHDAMNDAILYGTSSIWPFYTVEVHDNESDEKSYFLIGKPQTPCPSMFGRATKGFIAFDLAQHNFVWLKDSWRLASEHYHPEWEVYRKLHEKNVENIATMRCGGDVHGPKLQCTLTQESITDCRLKSRIHCRLVLNEVGRPLKTHQTSCDLIFIVACAFKAHSQAWRKAKVLHRDVSDNNIMITETIVDGEVTLTGILIDWDLCKYREQLKVRVATNENRSGTWQFISALRLQYPMKFYELADDVESFVHVINWCALRYHQHSLLGMPKSLSAYVNDMFFDCTASPEGLLYGCLTKWRAMAGDGIGFKIRHDKALKKVINKLVRVCHSHYRSLNLDELQKFQPASVREAQEQKKAQAQTVSDSSFPPRLNFRAALPDSALDEESDDDDADDDDEGESDDDNESDSSDSQPDSRRRGRPKLAKHKYVHEILADALQRDDWNPEPKPLDRDHFAKLLDLNFTVGRRTVTGTKDMTSSQRKRPGPTHSSRKKRKTGASQKTAHAVSGEHTSSAQLDALPEEDDAVASLEELAQVGTDLAAHSEEDAD
ncbi:unnamed protein product [Somion occarium]